MKNQEAKAEAEKIIQEYYEQIPEKVFETSLGYDTLNEWCNKAAIIHVKGIMKEMDIVKSEINPQWERWNHWQSILTELER